MTMIAGCVLPDGVLMAADCRISWAGLPFASDEAIKLVKLGDANVVGYAGDVRTMSWLLGHLLGPQLSHRRTDPVSVSRWLPRFLRATYLALGRRYPVRPVDIMVAASLKGRPTLLPRATLMGAVYQTKALDITNWLAVRCIREFEKRADPIIVPDSTAGLLYVMSSPDFEPRSSTGLTVAAIGSGMSVVNDLDLYTPLLMAGRPDRAVNAFVDALGGYYSESAAPGVGGALIMARLDRGRVWSLCLSEPTNGGQVEVFSRDGRFHVRNTATGQVVSLRYPAEIVKATAPRQMVLDDFKSSFAKERERRRTLRLHLEEQQREQDRLQAMNSQMPSPT